MTFLSNRIQDYYYVSQGKTRIPNVNDTEEFLLTDVSELWKTHFKITQDLTVLKINFINLMINL